MNSYLLVFVGGGIGASLRHTVNMLSARGLGTAFPWGTFIINISGSLIMGLIAGYLAFKGEASQPWRLFVMTGILARCRAALRAGRNRLRAVLRAGLGGAVDRRPVRRPRAGASSDVNKSAWASMRPRMGGAVVPFASLCRQD